MKLARSDDGAPNANISMAEFRKRRIIINEKRSGFSSGVARSMMLLL